MEERERAVKAAMDEKQRKHKAEIRQKRAQAEARIAAAAKGNADIQRKKRTDYEAKQAHAAELAVQVAERVAEETKAAAIKRQEDAKQAADRLESMKTITKDRIDRILANRAKRDGYLATVHVERDRLRKQRMVERDMKKDDKLGNVQRIKRIDEFVRLQTLQKIQVCLGSSVVLLQLASLCSPCLAAASSRSQDDDDRSANIRREKAELMAQRKRQTNEALMKKHQIL